MTTLAAVNAPPCRCAEVSIPAAADLVEAIARVAANHAKEWAPGGEGLCLPVTAAVCYTLAANNVDYVRAAMGSFDGHAHWWTRAGSLIVDPTRAQFDAGPLICSVGDVRYEVEREIPPGWSAEHVVLEAVRAFEFADAGRLFGESLLELLRLVARSY